jgi:hypothetical protein
MHWIICAGPNGVQLLSDAPSPLAAQLARYRHRTGRGSGQRAAGGTGWPVASGLSHVLKHSS